MRRVIFIALVAALVQWAAPANAITNGVRDGDAHPNVGALVAYEADLDLFALYCSGSLLDATHFLTAAHCVTWIDQDGYPLSDVFVTFDTDLRAYDGFRVIDPENLIPVSDVVPHPAFHGTPANGYIDVGVVTLATPVTGIEPIGLPDVGFLDREAAKGELRGHEFVNVGYGIQGGTMKGLWSPNCGWLLDGFRWNSVSPFMALTPAYLKQLTSTEATGDGGIGFLDSGSPHFYSSDPNDPWYNLAVAVQSGVDANLQAMSASTRLDIPIVHDWLETFL